MIVVDNYAEAKREAEYLAMTLYNKYYANSPDAVPFELLDTVAGIITQIDNMIIGIDIKIPEDYVLVPIEPTHKMHLAGESAYDEGMSAYPDPSEIYKAMIAAAQDGSK